MRLGPIIGKKNKDKKVPSSPQTMLFDSVIGDRLSFKYQVIIKRERKGWSNKVWYQYFGPPLSSFLWLVTLRFNGSELPVPLTFSRFARSFSCEGRPPRAYFEKVTQCNKRISHWRPTFFLPLSNSFAFERNRPPSSWGLTISHCPAWQGKRRSLNWVGPCWQWYRMYTEAGINQSGTRDWAV